MSAQAPLLLARTPREDLRDDFTRQLLSVAFLVRLLALVLGVLALRRSLTPQVLVVVLLLGVSSYVGVSRRSRLLDVVVRHPFLALVDVALVLAVSYVVGPDSPLVFATLSTALIVGVLFPTRVAVVLGVCLVAGYTAVWGRHRPAAGYGFVVVYGIPLLYASLIGVGRAVRAVHLDQLDTLTELAQTRTAIAAADERARLAREMHDSLAKTLHGVAMGAAALPHWVGTDPQRAVVQAQLLAEGAEQAAGEARSLLKRMRADQPDRPLAEILGGLCRDWGEQHRLECAFTARGVVDVCGDARYELVSIVGECLENVARHARASRVEVELSSDGRAAEVAVRDDGRGMPDDVGDLRRQGHFGLVGMLERALEVGGTLEVDSRPGQGTTVRARVPLSEGTRVRERPTTTASTSRPRAAARSRWRSATTTR